MVDGPVSQPDSVNPLFISPNASRDVEPEIEATTQDGKIREIVMDNVDSAAVMFTNIHSLEI